MTLSDHILLSFGWNLFLASFVILLVFGFIIITYKSVRKTEEKLCENEEKNLVKNFPSKILEFPKPIEKEVKKLKKKYFLYLDIDTKIAGLKYGLAASRESEPFKKPIENNKIKNFISWYNRGTTPVFYFHYTNGDLTCVHRDSIVGFKITTKIEVIDE